MLTLPPRRRMEIPVTSLVDILFNLLAFILVVGSLERMAPTRLDLEIPHGRGSSAAGREEISVVLDREGRLFIEGVPAEADEIPRLLRRLLLRKEAVVLWADRRVPYEKVVFVLSLVREGGGRHIRLAVLSEETQDGCPRPTEVFRHRTFFPRPY